MLLPFNSKCLIDTLEYLEVSGVRCQVSAQPLAMEAANLIDKKL